MILSVNIFEEDNQKTNKTNFFKKAGKKGLKDLNTDVWNNEKVVGISGYNITDIRACLHDLAEFISQNLSPNRLESFDLESIKILEPFNDIPQNLGLNLKNLQ